MKKNTIIVILALLVLILSSFIIYDKVIRKENTPNTNISKDNQDNKALNKVYKKGEEIKLKDGSKWLVLADSDQNSDTVKLMSIDEFGLSCDQPNTYFYCVESSNFEGDLTLEYFNINTVYEGSIIESIVNSFKNKIPATLKKVDGYEIRLLSIRDILEYDSNWEKIGKNLYKYKGQNLNEAFLRTWLMDVVEDKCEGKADETGRCYGNMGSFFIVEPQFNFDTNSVETIYLKGGHTGLSQVKPVIYALKSSI